MLQVKAVEGNNARVSTSYKNLPKDCKPGDPILLDDGKLRLRVVAVKGTDVHTRVEVGGLLKDHKGMNLPGVALARPVVTEKDLEDLRFGLGQGVNYVALSFVRHPDDVLKVKKLHRRRAATAPRSSPRSRSPRPWSTCAPSPGRRRHDGGPRDLGVEMDLDKVPMIQKEIIAMANATRPW